MVAFYVFPEFQCFLLRCIYYYFWFVVKEIISEFYSSNKIVIDEFASTTKTYDFATGEKTNISYTKAKIIDMYGFMVGLKLE